MVQDVAGLFTKMKVDKAKRCSSRNVSAAELENKCDDFLEIVQNAVEKTITESKV